MSGAFRNSAAVLEASYRDSSRRKFDMMTAAGLAGRTNLPLFTVRCYASIGRLKPLRRGLKLYKRTDKVRHSALI